MSRPGGGRAHRPFLESLHVPSAALAPLSAYLDLLAAWSERVNLTGARTAEERVRLLVADPLALAPHLEPGLVLDVGSGNGSPGLVLAALRPDLPIALLEPRQKRWAFLREAARAIGRPDVRVERVRHDAYPGPQAQTVALRALSLPLRELAGLVRPGGVVAIMGVPPVPEEGFEALPPVPAPGGDVSRYRRCST